MKIPVTCGRCGKQYEVDGAYAGKKGKCAACGERMMIPAPQHGDFPAATEPDAYSLEEPGNTDRSTSFTPTRGSENLDEPRPRRRRNNKNPRESGRDRAGPSGARAALSWQAGLIGLACVVAIASLIAVFLPAARMNVGRGVALAGLILFLWSYGSGAYIAFIEDDLYGWLYLMFPPYAAYYFVSRWDEMMSRFVMLIVGLALLAGGGRLLETARSAGAAEEARAHGVG